MTPGAAVPGERTVAVAPVAQSRAVRLQRALSVCLLIVVGGAILGWYYLHLGDERRVTSSTRSTLQTAVESEMRLPALAAPERTLTSGGATGTPAPPHPRAEGSTGIVDDTFAAQGRAAPHGLLASPPAGEGERSAVDVRVMHDGGPVLSRGAGVREAPTPGDTGGEADLAAGPAPSPVPADATSRSGSRPAPLADAPPMTVTTPVEAGLLPSRRWLLPKGSFLDCTLETAVDSTFAGLATCVLATDIFGADGRVVLLERGTKLVGESRSDARPGQARVAILWTEAVTPTGVSVSLSSPATDALGRAGVPGDVDRHTGERFGAAVLLSMIDGAVAAAASRQAGTGTVIYNAQSSHEVATEALRNTISIPPTIRVAPGARVMVAVVRDIDFRRVYRLTLHGDR